MTTAYENEQKMISHLVNLGTCNIVLNPINQKTHMKSIIDGPYEDKNETNSKISESVVLNQI